MKQIILTEKQTEAIKFFNEYHYLVVDAPRKSGKTILLQAIVEQNQDKSIGVYCLSYDFFQRHYGRFKNCKFVSGNIENENFDLLIGDEFLIVPQKRPTACAFTQVYVTLRWKLKDYQFVHKEELDNIKKTLNEKAWLVSFGQYEA
jgi:hypothetical protein